MSAVTSRGIVLAEFEGTTFTFEWEAKAGDAVTFWLVNKTTDERLGAITQWQLKEEVTANVAKNALTACLSTAPSTPEEVQDFLRAEIGKLFEERRKDGDDRWARWSNVKDKEFA